MNCDSKLELPEKILLSTKKQAQVNKYLNFYLFELF